MFNTPPVFPIFVLNETLKWLKSIGGVEEMYRRNVEKAELLYNEIERNSLFRPTVAKEDRSLMNICFVMTEGNEDLAPEFLEFAKERGMVGIKGHRLVGGFRASCYNAYTPILKKESFVVLLVCMECFQGSSCLHGAELCSSLPKASAKVRQIFITPNFLRRKFRTFFTLFYKRVILNKLYKKLFSHFYRSLAAPLSCPHKRGFSNDCGMAK